MFERYTDRARRSVQLAQEEAHRFGSDAIGPEHILLGILSEGETLAAKALAACGIDLVPVRAAVESLPRRHRLKGHMEYTPDGMKVMTQAIKERVTLDQNFIGTEHLLLALLAQQAEAEEPVLPRILHSLGLDSPAPDIRGILLRLLADDEPRRPAGPIVAQPTLRFRRFTDNEDASAETHATAWFADRPNAKFVSMTSETDGAGGFTVCYLGTPADD